MQDVINAVNLSPPVLAPQKPAAYVATTPDQESFDMALKKASECKTIDKCVDAEKVGRETEEKTKADSQSSGKSFVAVIDVKKELTDNVDYSSNDECKTRAEIPTILASDLEETIPTGSVSLVSNPATNSQAQSIVRSEIEKREPISKTMQGDSAATKQMLYEPQTKNMIKNVDGLNTVQKTVDSEIEGLVLSENRLFDRGSSVSDLPAIGSDDSFQVDQDLKVNQKQVTKENLKASKNEGAQQESKFTVSRSIMEEFQKTESVAIGTSEQNSKTRIKTERTVEAMSTSAPPESQVLVEGEKMYSTTRSEQIIEPARLAEAQKNEMITRISDQLDGLLKTNRSSFRMQLYPAELGHIDLRIVSNKGGVDVTLIADKASTQQVLQSELSSLRQTIEQAGIQLNTLNIAHDQSSNKHQQFEGRPNLAHQSEDYQSNSTLRSVVSDDPRLVSLRTSEIDYRI